MNYATPVRTLIHLFVLLAVAAVMAGAAQQKKQASLSNTPGTESPLASTVLARLISIDLQDESFENALKKIAVQAKLRVLFSRDIVPASKRITLAVNAAPLSRVLGEVLHDTQLDYLISEAGLLVLTQKERVEDETGTIVGRVLEARTNKPLPGANVFVEGTTLGMLVDAEGNFKIERVPPGKYKLRASVVGYGKISKDITVRAGNQITLDFFLNETAVGLDEVVVTGVAFETRRREIPADIAVMTSKQIAQKNASNITDVLKGEIPGVFALQQGQFDFITPIFLRGSGMSISGTEYAKIFIDGIELSNPSYLSTIDPKSIERIEVIRGAHAAALYGAEAIAGVIQIITKKGGNTGLDRPLISAQISAGYIQSSFLGKKVTPSGIKPFQTDYGIQISGGKAGLSYRTGVNYATVGEWMQHYGSRKLSLSGGMRFAEGPIIGELTALWSHRDYDDPSTSFRYDRWPGLAPTGYRSEMVYPNNKHDFDELTVGLNLNYQMLPNWIHGLVVGQNNSGYDYWQAEPHYLVASDTLVFKWTYAYSRRSIRYNTSYQQRIGEMFSARLTAGVEYSLYNSTLGIASNIKLNQYGDIVTTSRTTNTFSSQNRWTAGYSGVLEMGYMDRFFVTLSSSAKQDPRGAEKTYITPPRVGLSYSQKLGAIEARLRGQYGAAIKPVDPYYVDPSRSSRAAATFLPNYDLVPERRGGWDAGIDLFWANDASLSFTRFDEEGRDIIQLATLDVGPPIIYQYQNIARMGVVGYELAGKLNFGFAGLDNVTLNLNYSYSDNRILGLSSYYASSPTQTYEVGDRVQGVPKHSGGGSLSINAWRGSATLDWQFSGGWRNTDLMAWYDYRYGTAVHRDAGKKYSEFGTATTFAMMYKGQTFTVNKGSITRSYHMDYPVYVKFHLRAEQEISEGVSVFLNVNNLFNEASSDLLNSYAVQGRVTTLGVRVSY